MSFGINVNASSNTTYSGFYRYMFWHDYDKQAIQDLYQLDSRLILNRYLNVPLRVANYCQYFPGHNGTSCPTSYNAQIGMVGLANGTLNSSNPAKDYSGSISFVNTLFKYNNNTYGYFSNSNNNATKIKYGYFNTNNNYNSFSQTHKQNIYYLDDTHTSYPTRSQFNVQLQLSSAPNTTSDITQPGFSEGNIIMYKMSYMLGPSNGNYGDGTWSTTSHTYDPDNCPDCYPSYMSFAYEQVRQNVTYWFRAGGSQTYNNYEDNYGSWLEQNRNFGHYFDLNSGIPGNKDPEQYGEIRAFQAATPMYTFLNLNGHTYYDQATSKKYYHSPTYNVNTGTYTHEFLENSQNVYGEVILRNNDNNVKRLNTSVIIVAQPYYYKYTENGTDYYSEDTWFLDFYWFAYIDGTYNFNQIYFRFNFENQLSTYPNVRQLDLYMPDTYVTVIGSGSLVQQAYTDLQSGIVDTINNIPVIGPIIGIILEILIFCFGFILSCINLLSVLPSWIRGGILVAFVSIVIRIIYKLIRGG